MIKRPIALVLGAGASVPYGFPTARDLLRDVRKGLNDQNFRLRLLGADYREDEIRDLREALAGSPVGSVDEFLEIDAHARLVPVGKAAIAASLLPRESPHNLLPDAQDNDDWYEYLFRRMREGAGSLDAFLENGVRFVTFNYDRSLEQFLVVALQRTYAAKASEIAQAFKQSRLQIVHVYGSFGALPVLGGDLSYGVEPNVTGLVLRKAADSINVMGEPAAREGIDAAHSALMACERVCFVGFGYRTANVARLELKTTLRKDAHVFGSAYKYSQGELDDVSVMFRREQHSIVLSGPSADALNALKELPALSQFELTHLEAYSAKPPNSR